MLDTHAETHLAAYRDREFGTPSFTCIVPGVWYAAGMAHSNATVIEGAQSCILVDTFDSVERAEALKAKIAAEIGKPVRTIIYTHGHPDHRGGAAAFADTVEEVIAFCPRTPTPPGLGAIQDVFNKRGMLQFGFNLSDEEAVTQGLGPREGRAYGESVGFLPPTTCYEGGVVARTIDGVALSLHFAPGESPDQCFVWLPDRRVLCCGDNYYACFPNLYALRGTPYREVADWIEALETIMAQEANYLLPGHTRPLIGAETIREVLGNYRDAIRFVYDETLACLRKDWSIDAAAEHVRLPAHLRDLPYLQEFYGTVAWSVRSIYVGHIGWFDGNPTHLEPLPRAERAANYLALIGGRAALIDAVRTALAEGKAQWAAELTDHLLALDEADAEARALKAEALEALAPLETSANGRHYYQNWAKILRGTLTFDQ